MRHAWWFEGGRVTLDDLRRLQAAPVVGRVGHKVTAPLVDQAKAIATVTSAGHAYVEWCGARRFGSFDGWKPATAGRRRLVAVASNKQRKGLE